MDNIIVLLLKAGYVCKMNGDYYNFKTNYNSQVNFDITRIPEGFYLAHSQLEVYFHTIIIEEYCIKFYHRKKLIAVLTR